MSSATATKPRRTKHYLPLESNPEVFTQLIHNLGIKSLAFQDVYSLDDPDMLTFLPRPAYALVLVFPTSDAHEKFTKEAEEKRTLYGGKGEEEEVVWFRQTIGNACGLYGILHAVSNGAARDHVDANTALARLLKECIPLDPTARATALEDSTELESAHRDAAVRGDTAPPASAEDDVDYHYVCFVASQKNRRVYEMDGMLKGPVGTGVVLDEGEDVLSDKVLQLVRNYVKREEGKNLGFSLLALVPNLEG